MAVFDFVFPFSFEFALWLLAALLLAVAGSLSGPLFPSAFPELERLALVPVFDGGDGLLPAFALLVRVASD